jgi:2-dehydropantoate 2-reductase
VSNAEFAIVGAGAIGSILGAHLARAGHDVLMIARGARAAQVERAGLQLRGLAELSQAVRVLIDPAQLQHAETLIVATKTYATAEVLARLREARVGVALSLQNGLMKNAQLAGVFGEERVLGALADTSGELTGGGEVLFTRNEQVLLGELSGALTPRARRLAEIIDASGVRAEAVADIRTYEWSKFAAWAGLMVLSVTTRAPTWRFLTDADSARVLARVVRELGQLAGVHGVSLSDRAPLPVATIVRESEDGAVAVIQAAGERYRVSAPQHKMSSLQDLEAGRRMEIEETLGYAVRLAAEAKRSVPLTESLYRIAASLDRIRA